MGGRLPALRVLEGWLWGGGGRLPEGVDRGLREALADRSLGCCVPYWPVLGHTGLCSLVLVCAGSVLGCAVLYWAILGCAVL